ncbi:MAG: glycoside hydrolase family 30 protein [Bacteroidales bacterium]|nr:glycoside hydrolase family 30 protein [Bacteroidales bacterium]
MKTRIAIFLLAAFCAAFSCNPPVQPEPVPEEGAVKVYTTNTSGLRFQESSVALEAAEKSDFSVLLTGETFQTVEGFGFAITQASCFNLLRMPEADRKQFLTEMFSREKGLGSSLIRVCIGGSDFSLDEFTWCDKQGLDNFAVHPLDEQYLFPILDEIFAINPKVKIIASPWSCPKWMKMDDNGRTPFDSWTSGRLNPVCYQEYANYFALWIREMEKRGYPIYAITLQNEPLNRGNSMSLYMSWEEQRDFLRDAVGPALAAAGLKTKVLLFDHNYNFDNIASQVNYPLRILEDPAAAKYAAGTAWHNYGGSVSTLDRVHEQFPDKDIFFTEASIGTWNYNYERCLIDDFREIFLGTLSRWGKGVTYWNLMLDDKRSPYRPGGCSTCYGGVTISSSTYSYGSIDRSSQYYQVAHCSKVLDPGAVRLGTKGYTNRGLTYQWYRNPDGSYGVLLLNENAVEAKVVFTTDRHSVTCKVPPMAIQSVRWKE